MLAEPKFVIGLSFPFYTQYRIVVRLRTTLDRTLVCLPFCHNL